MKAIFLLFVFSFLTTVLAQAESSAPTREVYLEQNEQDEIKVMSATEFVQKLERGALDNNGKKYLRYGYCFVCGIYSCGLKGFPPTFECSYDGCGLQWNSACTN